MNINRKLLKYNDEQDKKKYKKKLEIYRDVIESNISNIDEINSTKSTKEKRFEEKLEKLEQFPSKTFLELNSYDIDNFENTNMIYNFLYHGIRFQKHLEKLESIFQDGAILAGNYQKKYYNPYDDNCNEGEYVSVMNVENDYELEYETFVMPNISLVISPECNAVKTIYLPYEEWEQLKGRTTKNRYSYAKNEYHVKKMIPLYFVKAIGLPARYLRLTNKQEQIDTYLIDILHLMEKYNINLPIVDTSFYNKPLFIPNNHPLNEIPRKYIRKKKKMYR